MFLKRESTEPIFSWLSHEFMPKEDYANTALREHVRTAIGHIANGCSPLWSVVELEKASAIAGKHYRETTIKPAIFRLLVLDAVWALRSAEWAVARDQAGPRDSVARRIARKLFERAADTLESMAIPPDGKLDMAIGGPALALYDDACELLATYGQIVDTETRYQLSLAQDAMAKIRPA